MTGLTFCFHISFLNKFKLFKSSLSRKNFILHVILDQLPAIHVYYHHASFRNLPNYFDLQSKLNLNFDFNVNDKSSLPLSSFSLIHAKRNERTDI